MDSESLEMDDGPDNMYVRNKHIMKSYAFLYLKVAKFTLMLFANVYVICRLHDGFDYANRNRILICIIS